MRGARRTEHALGVSVVLEHVTQHERVLLEWRHHLEAVKEHAPFVREELDADGCVDCQERLDRIDGTAAREGHAGTRRPARTPIGSHTWARAWVVRVRVRVRVHG